MNMNDRNVTELDEATRQLNKLTRQDLLDTLKMLAVGLIIVIVSSAVYGPCGNTPDCPVPIGVEILNLMLLLGWGCLVFWTMRRAWKRRKQIRQLSRQQ